MLKEKSIAQETKKLKYLSCRFWLDKVTQQTYSGTYIL